MRDLMRVPAVAKELDVSPATLAHWRQAGKGPKWAKLGRHVVYRRSDIERWIDEQFAAAK